VGDVADENRHEQVESARVRAQLTVSELWLRYVALGGNGDLFDIDGYLAGLVPMTAFDQNVLAVAVNERLEEIYRAARVPLATPNGDPAPAGEQRDVVARLLDAPRTHRTDPLPDPADEA
jgi:hypothetical protein